MDDDDPNPTRAVNWLRLLAWGLVLAPSMAAAQPIFKWVDEQGHLHVTDVLAEVPEPYYTTYRTLLEAQKEATEGKEPTSLPPPSPSTKKPPAPTSYGTNPNTGELPSQRLRKQRESWQKLLEWWRNELRVATEALEKAEQEVLMAQQNPILRHTPQAQSEIQRSERAREQALARVQRARKALTEDLPARAKKEGVPPKWLQ